QRDEPHDETAVPCTQSACIETNRGKTRRLRQRTAQRVDRSQFVFQNPVAGEHDLEAAAGDGSANGGVAGRRFSRGRAHSSGFMLRWSASTPCGTNWKAERISSGR